MRTLIAVLLFVLLITQPVKAEGLTYIPNETSQITLYDFASHSLKLGIRYPALNWKELIYLEGALVTDFDSISIAGGISIELVSLGRRLGLNVMLAKNVMIGFLTGYNFRTEETIYGFYSGVKWSW